LLFNKEFLIDTLSRDEVRDLRLVESVDDVGEGDGGATLIVFTGGDTLDTDTLSFTPFRSTELDRLWRANFSMLSNFALP
jgi:hypothetical protein